MNKRKSSIATPHDRYFRAAMSHKPVAHDFFKHHLPSHIQSQVDLTCLELKADHFVDKALGLVMTDILYGVTIDHQPGYLYVLVEHRSTPDKLMAFRVLKGVVAKIGG